MARSAGAAVGWLICAAGGVAAGHHNHKHGHKKDPHGPHEHIISLRPHEHPDFSPEHLPEHWDWRNVDGKDFTGRIMNQHQPGPEYCGACWAFSTITALNARFNVARKAVWPKTELNVQVLLSCGPNINNGCDGSDPNLALKFIHEYGLPHESCHTYSGMSLECTPYNLCQDCMADYTPVCWTRDRFPMYHLKEYGVIMPKGNGSDPDLKKRHDVIEDMGIRMKAEIWRRGPIVCQIACPDPATGPAKTAYVTANTTGLPYGQIRGYMDDYTPFYNIAGDNFKPFIMNSPFECPSGDWNDEACTDHDVTIVGWGEEHGVPYWLIQNSWGDWWGEGGFFRVIMGRNTMGIESGCTFGVPDVSHLEDDPTGYPHFPMGTSAIYADRFQSAQEAKAKLENQPVVFYS